MDPQAQALRSRTQGIEEPEATARTAGCLCSATFYFRSIGGSVKRQEKPKSRTRWDSARICLAVPSPPFAGAQVQV